MSAPEWAPSDWYPGLGCCTDGGSYIYGINYSVNNIVERFNTDTGVITQLFDFGANIPVLTMQRMSNGTMFACVGNNDALGVSNQLWTLYRSTTNGTSWSAVSVLGVPDGGGGQVIGVAIQNCNSMCEATINGVRTLFYGEYNVSPSGGRVAGGANDEVKIMKSVDDGVTWTKVIKWNTAGSNIVTHCHAVKFLNGRFYVLNGDALGSGIIEWNPSATAGVWTAADNSTYATIGGLSGYAVISDLSSVNMNEKGRATEMLYRPQDGMLYWITDSVQATHGIYACKPGLTGLTLRNSTLMPANHEGYYGGITSDGRMTFVSSCQSAVVGTAAHYVYASDDGWDWRLVARHALNKAVATPVPQAVFMLNDKLVISTKDGARKRDRGTTICTNIGSFIDERPAQLAPCYWVAPNGVNVPIAETTSQGGWSPRNPLADPGYALTSPSNRVTHGARIMVAPGTYTTSRIALNWSDTGTRDAEAGQPVIVDLGGRPGNRTATQWVHDASDILVYLLYHAATLANQRLEIRNGWCYEANTTLNSTLITCDEPTAAFEFVGRDAAFGHPSNAFLTNIGVLRPDVATEMTTTLYRCAVMENPAAASGTNVLFFRTAGAQLRAYSSVFYGGNSVTMNLTRATTDIELDNCLFTGVTNGGGNAIQISGAADTPPILKNVIFDTASAATSINDTLNLATWSVNNQNGIAYTKAFTGANLNTAITAGITAGVNLNLVGQSTGVVFNTSDFSLTVTSTSTLREKGAYKIAYDYNRGYFRNPPTIGPVEYATSIRGAASRIAASRAPVP